MPSEHNTEKVVELQRENTVRWDKVPDVPRPSLVPEPFTVWGRKRKEDGRHNIYQYSTIPDAGLRGRNPADDDHKRQLLKAGTITKTNMDASSELALKGHVFEKGILARKSGSNSKHTSSLPSGRTRILMALQKPSWYRF